MDEASASSLSKQTIALFKETSKIPFPYAGIRKITRQYPSKYDDLTPDIDWFESTVRGYSSRADGIENWSLSETEEAMTLLSLSFYDKHPKYQPLEQDIASQADVSYDIEVHEKMRQSLLLLLDYRKSRLTSK